MCDQSENIAQYFLDKYIILSRKELLNIITDCNKLNHSKLLGI